MDTKNVNRVVAAITFVISFTTFYMTVQPTVPFWDCGEFTSATVEQQVPHPPGAPLFLMVGKLFHMLPIGNPQDSGFRINLVSVAASAFTILLLYLTLVMVINAFRKKPLETMGDMLAVYGSAFVGAMAFNFSDTFWFNGVESEVYASSSLFVQIVVYLMMRWWEKADEPGHERYLLMIAYVIGLSVGVHLLSILAIFSIVYLVYFRKYTFSTKGVVLASGFSLLVFIVIYKIIIMSLPSLIGGNLPFKNELHEYYVENSDAVTFLTFLGIIGVVAGMIYGFMKNRKMLALTCTSVVFVMLGFTTYTHIILRSQANPPMNENMPKTLDGLVSYIGREQYGEAPNWPRRYETQDQGKIRKYKDYGKWNPPVAKEVKRLKDNQFVSIGVPDKQPISGELSYLFRYQIYQMYVRYFLWNFVGRSSDLQDSDYTFLSKGESEIRNFNSGYKDWFPIRFWALPFIFGLIGFIFHVSRDPKNWWVYLVMFLMMGVLAAMQQNQQNPQPRERDYFYAGSFMVWCLWIGIGVYAIIDFLREKTQNAAIGGAVVLGSLALVPVNMAYGGWNLHSRAGNYLPFDYSYNILQSVEKDAILFTNGDNDTFPVWYLQDVAGIRRDVRVVNLSLGNTLWYIDQLKNQEPWGAKKIPLSFKDESLQVSENDENALGYNVGYEQNISIPIDANIMRKYTNDSAVINKGTMDFVFTGHSYQRDKDDKQMYLFQVQDKLILDILQQVKFTRPIYFSTTSGYPGSETFVGLSDFLRLEGMAYRILPVRQTSSVMGMPINESVMNQCLMNNVEGTTAYPEPHYGFKFRNLNDVGVYYDEHHRNYLDSYRRIFLQYAAYLYQEKNNTNMCVKVLDKLNEVVSPRQFPINYTDLLNIADLYNSCGKREQAKKFATLLVERTNILLSDKKKAAFENGTDRPYFHPALYQSDGYALLGDAQNAKSSLERYMQEVGNDLRAKYRMDAIDVRVKAAKGNYTEALAEAEALMGKYQSDPQLIQAAGEVSKLVHDIRNQMGKPMP
ncbi:MAG: DUF2723 domain-containing protein [Candidatus Kapaibacterium sp.]|nr:DUF2723 domain-containing protein [Bacteroidota bacterium]